MIGDPDVEGLGDAARVGLTRDRGEGTTETGAGTTGVGDTGVDTTTVGAGIAGVTGRGVEGTTLGAGELAEKTGADASSAGVDVGTTHAVGEEGS